MGRIAADATVFHAIADPTRRSILESLAGGQERPALSLLAGARVTQSSLSQHLAVLRRAGLVAMRKAGRSRLYRISPEPLAEVADWVAIFDRFWGERLDRLGKHLDTHRDAPVAPPTGRARRARK